MIEVSEPKIVLLGRKLWQQAKEHHSSIYDQQSYAGSKENIFSLTSHNDELLFDTDQLLDSEE